MVYFLYIMAIFEFDPTKSDSNFEKHKIDFIQIQALWQDPDLIEFKAKSDTEPRYLFIDWKNSRKALVRCCDISC